MGIRFPLWVLSTHKTVKIIAVSINISQKTHPNCNPNPNLGLGLGLNSELVSE